MTREEKKKQDQSFVRINGLMNETKNAVTQFNNSLFSSEVDRKYGSLEEVDIDKLIEFKDHTFKVVDNNEMKELSESIKEHGIMNPLIAFYNEDEQIELIAGHRRCFALKQLGLDKAPVLIKRISRDKATVMMGETNLKSRERILPSEKAFTYKLMLDAMKRQGKRNDLTNSTTGTSVDALSEIVKENREQIRRYIRLTNLVPELLNIVDQDVMALRPAVEISYLSNENQNTVYEYFKIDALINEDGTVATKGVLPSLAQAQKMKKMEQEGILDEDAIMEILDQEKPNQKEKVVFKSTALMKYKKDLTPQAFEEKIIKALDYYEKHIEKGIGRE